MSVEVEILSRVLAYRLSGVAPALIHPTQAGFERGRCMRDHIIFIEALQHKATKEQVEWCATFLDFAKAYDWVNQHFLFDFMAKMSIGSNFLSWIPLLYHRPQVNFLLNGPSVYPNRGVKQGCPLLRLLFDLYIEPLGATLRMAPDLGIPVGEGDPLTSIFFADDSTILSNSLESAEYQVDYIVRTFCETSGAPLNLSKCTTTGSRFKNTYQIPGDLCGPPNPTDTRQVLVGVHKMDIPIQGRRVLGSTLILSHIWHVTAVKVVTDDLLQKWHRVLTNYILGLKTIDDPNTDPSSTNYGIMKSPWDWVYR
ncbi:hypothetical protein AeRB84_012846 [Aphanomyces euteiches]|nr:hypothetical protein AeRB84_012846 [Aphanomyces euteiches]